MSVHACFIVEGVYYRNLLSVSVEPWTSKSPVLSLAKALVYYLKGKSPINYPTVDHQMFQLLEKCGVFYPCLSLQRHEAYKYWHDYICNQIQKGKAIRNKQEFYVQIQFAWQGQMTTASSLREFLEKEKIIQSLISNGQRVILLIFKKDCRTNKFPFIPLRALYMGIYFNNQSWKTYQVANQQFPSDLELQTADLILLPGSNSSVLDSDADLQKFSQRLVYAFGSNRKVKILGNCFGHQLIAKSFGGKVRKAVNPISGQYNVTINQQFLNFARHSKLQMTQFHQDQVCETPENFRSLADCPAGGARCEIMVSSDNRILSTQGHPQYSQAFAKNMGMQRGLNQRLFQQIRGSGKLPEQDLTARALTLAFVGIDF